MENLSKIRDLADYAKVIDTLLVSFVKTDEFAEGTEKERSDIVDSCQELKSELLKTG